MTHPLTDDVVIRYFGLKQIGWEKGRERVFVTQAMRTAADWQLEQVIEWIRKNLTWIEEDGLPRYLKNSSHEECAVIDEWKVISDLKQAMRPTTTTTTQEDN